MLALLWLVVLWGAAVFAALVAFNLLLARLIERWVPPIGQFVEIDGLRLHYIDSGAKLGQDGPPLLFVHGWLGQLNHYSYALAALFPERRVVLVDRPGCGYSQAARTSTIAENAAVLSAFIDKIGLEKPLVVGHSLGGAIALSLALDHAGKIAGLALIAPFTQFLSASAFYKAMAEQGRVSRWISAWLLGPVLSVLRSASPANPGFAPESVPKNFWRGAGGALPLRANALLAGALELPAQQRELEAMRERYGSISHPVSILFGAGDRLLDPKAQGEAFCALAPTADLKVIDGGHCLPMTQPKHCETFIRAALARQ
ncbi:pimeloyl-ACP methyl ester carboxylesterase [Rhodoblastus acidophilus]|uniref:alpha/beta fold hydrolase n=1 Tax=Rhodoblastus acidophilus TaxID=1074 RepID=UPI002223F9D2|nr:alpha/beta hydrolase [Rhodoblastus acidophilus]MCW2282475.1 pimeloyl-ACP methyl ester carboxylesterase [Rhodoblastus acidophilus]MCW2331120.1 pimeloyl-ACP methyl ester carboxylesterase [Rhodoblastus acidophilus]